MARSWHLSTAAILLALSGTFALNGMSAQAQSTPSSETPDSPVLLTINGAKGGSSKQTNLSSKPEETAGRASSTSRPFSSGARSHPQDVESNDPAGIFSNPPPPKTAPRTVGTTTSAGARKTPPIAGERKTPPALSESRVVPADSSDETKPRQIAQRMPIMIGDYGLSTVTVEMVNKWKIGPFIANLDDSYKQWQSTKTSEDAIQYLIHKQKLTETLADLGFDVRRCTNAVDREIARNSSRAAYLTELRDKAIRYNTYADFVAGGLTGIVSGALEMADISRFANTSVDIAEGAGQSALSYWAFRAEHAGDRSQQAVPNVLAAIMDPSLEHKAYPESVAAFLNTAPPDSNGQTRAAMMRARWDKLNFCFTHPGTHKMKKHHRVKHLTGQHEEDATMTIDLLEDRTAMLHDVRAEITTMDESLAELFDLLHKY